MKLPFYRMEEIGNGVCFPCNRMYHDLFKREGVYSTNVVEQN